jgi:hypothetical protein
LNATSWNGHGPSSSSGVAFCVRLSELKRRACHVTVCHSIGGRAVPLATEPCTMATRSWRPTRPV